MNGREESGKIHKARPEDTEAEAAVAECSRRDWNGGLRYGPWHGAFTTASGEAIPIVWMRLNRRNNPPTQKCFFLLSSYILTFIQVKHFKDELSVPTDAGVVGRGSGSRGKEAGPRGALQ